jgi:transposase
LNELLDGERFDEFCERECVRFYADHNGRPSLTPGTYFRLLLIGYCEGIDSERGMAWRASDSLGLREFLRIGRRDNGAGYEEFLTGLARQSGLRLPHGKTWPASTGNERRRLPMGSG